jgi:hypothetical protein
LLLKQIRNIEPNIEQETQNITLHMREAAKKMDDAQIPREQVVNVTFTIPT